MKSQGLKKNLLFQIIYQIIILVVPLIVSPYLTRTLGPENLGIYSYTYSIAYYFVIFGKLGIEMHGQRIISSRKKDNLKLRKTFWSLYFVHFITSIVSLLIYVLLCFISFREYQNIYIIQIIYVAGVIFDVTWLFYGLENFKSVVIRNLIIKVVECMSIFIFVKDSSSLRIYTLIMSFSFLFSQFVMLPKVFLDIRPIKFSYDDVKEHIKPLILLFISTLAASLYTMFDKTLLGLILPNIDDVAFYEYSNKIINIPKTLLALFGVVFFPRVCNAVANKNFDKQRQYVDISLTIILLFGIAFAFGITSIANKFSILYFGDEFSVCGTIMIAMSPLIVFVPLGDIMRREYALPAKKDALHVGGVVVSAIINVIISSCLIPFLGIFGAVLGSLIAELADTIFLFILGKSVVNFRQFIKEFVGFLLIGTMMALVLYAIDVNVPTNRGRLLFEVFIGGVFYISLSVLFLFLFCNNKRNFFVKNLFIIKKSNTLSNSSKQEPVCEESKKDKVLLLTLFENNYGSILQCLSTKTLIEKLGYECVVIRRIERPNKIYKLCHYFCFMFKSMFFPSYFFDRVERKKSIFKDSKILNDETKKAMSVFVEKYLTPTNLTYREFKRVAKESKTKFIIVGSDQVWNMSQPISKYFILPFKTNAIKIAFAASFGGEKVKKYNNYAFKKIRVFDYISIREETGISLINKYTKKCFCYRVGDPTILLEKGERTKLLELRKFTFYERYVLIHFLNEPSALACSTILRFCNEKNKKPIFVGYNKKFASKIAGAKFFDAGPSEFINFLTHSDYVFTDSYHTVLFSINFEKNFLCFQRQYTHSSSQESRLKDLLKRYNLTNRFINSEHAINIKLPDISSSILNADRDLTLKFLLNALQLNKENL